MGDHAGHLPVERGITVALLSRRNAGLLGTGCHNSPAPTINLLVESIAMHVTTVLIMGAAGRHFDNFNVVFRDHPEYRVVAFTAAQIPNIAGRRYPPELAGSLYPQGIPIHPEDELESPIATYKVAEAIFSYSDISDEDVMHQASRVIAGGRTSAYWAGVAL